MWIELLADVVEHADPAVTHDERLTDLPTAIRRGVEKRGQQGRNLRGDGGGRESVTDDDLQSRAARTTFPERVFRFRIKASAHVRPREVFRLRSRFRRKLEQTELPHEVCSEITHHIEFCVDGIDSGGVIAAKFQCGRSAIRHAGSASPQSSGSVFLPAK